MEQNQEKTWPLNSKIQKKKKPTKKKKHNRNSLWKPNKNLEYRQTNSYGLQNVKTELTLLIIAINLKKIFNKITEN